MSIRVAINGFGRIGRSFFRLARERSELQMVAINDLADIENLRNIVLADWVTLIHFAGDDGIAYVLQNHIRSGWRTAQVGNILQVKRHGLPPDL